MKLDSIVMTRYESLRGLRHRLLVRGSRISSVAAMSSSGVLAYEFHTNTLNGDNFVRGKLIPSVQPFPGPNLMDNCSIHHVEEVKQETYSPDYNPCEEMFSYVKY